MKKIRILALALVSVVLMSFMTVAPFAAEDTENLIVNGTFDTDLSGWEYALGTSTWNEGGYATLPQESGTALGQVINGITPGTMYFFEADAKSEADATGGIIIYFTWLDSTNEISSSQISFGSSTEWRNFSRFVTAPEGTTRIRIWFRNTNGTQQFSFDNVSFYEKDSEGLVTPGSNLNMDTVDENGFPVGYKATGTATAETSMVFSGTGIKLANSAADQTSTVTKAINLNTSGTDFNIIEALVYYRLTDTEFTEGATNEGVTLEATNYTSTGFAISGHLNNYKTEYFTQPFTDGWKQMMVFIPANRAQIFDLVITLTGKATLYIDEIVVRGTKHLVNGDFQGLIGDGVPAGWAKDEKVRAVWNKEGTLIETLNSDNKTYENKVKQTFSYAASYGLEQMLYASSTGLTLNKIYNISYDYSNSRGETSGIAPRLSTLIGAKNLTGNGYYTIGHDDASGRYDFYLKYVENQYSRLHFGISSRADGIFDNVTMREVVERATITRDGVEIDRVAAGDDILISYERPGVYDGTNPEDKVTMLAAVYRHDGDTKTLSDIYLVSDAYAKEAFVLDSSKFSETTLPSILGTTAGTYSNSNATEGAGLVPAKISRQISIPDDGNTYSVKACFWNSSSGMQPYIKAVEALPAVQ